MKNTHLQNCFLYIALPGRVLTGFINKPTLGNRTQPDLHTNEQSGAQLLHISQMCNEGSPHEMCLFEFHPKKKAKVKVNFVDYLMHADVIFVKEGKII